MLKIVSETLVMHSQTLIQAMDEYAYKTWVTNGAECGIKNAIPEFDHSAISREAMASVVARILMDAIAAMNANCDYFYRPEITLPQIPTEKYKAWRESGNAGMFTIAEMYDAHCRELKLSPLLEGAIKWYSTRFVGEIYAIVCGSFTEWENDNIIYADWQTLTQQLLDGRVILALLDQKDYSYVTDADTLEELRDEIVAHPHGFLIQDEAKVLYDSIPRYILDNDDQDSDARPGIELYMLYPEVVAQLKNL